MASDPGARAELVRVALAKAVRANSFERLEYLIDQYDELGWPIWVEVLGRARTVCDLVSPYREELKALLGTEGPIVELMNDEERLAYERLPAEVLVYRGAGERNRNGLSWSLSREVALKFLRNPRFSPPRPMLYTAAVAKNRILAMKLDRNELEVVTFAAKIITAEFISPARLGVG